MADLSMNTSPCGKGYAQIPPRARGDRGSSARRSRPQVLGHSTRARPDRRSKLRRSRRLSVVREPRPM